jgi:hypothetical protein
MILRMEFDFPMIDSAVLRSLPTFTKDHMKREVPKVDISAWAKLATPNIDVQKSLIALDRDRY